MKKSLHTYRNLLAHDTSGKKPPLLFMGKKFANSQNGIFPQKGIDARLLKFPYMMLLTGFYFRLYSIFIDIHDAFIYQKRHDPSGPKWLEL